jgi:hypothetical protein
MILKVEHASGAGGIGLFFSVTAPSGECDSGRGRGGHMGGSMEMGSGKFIDGWTAWFVLALVRLVMQRWLEAKRTAPVGWLKLAQ